MIKLGLAGFFDAGVQVADLRIEPDDDLAVDLDHQAQNAMHRWMLRPHVQHHMLIVRACRRLQYGHSKWIAHQRYPSTG